MGSPGETYTIKHDTIDRKAYMPGVLQAIKKILQSNFESAIESNKPVGPDPTILKLNLFFIRLYKHHLSIQINIANFFKCWS